MRFVEAPYSKRRELRQKCAKRESAKKFFFSHFRAAATDVGDVKNIYVFGIAEPYKMRFVEAPYSFLDERK